MAEKKSSRVQTILLVVLIIAIAGFKVWRRMERKAEAEGEKAEMIRANNAHQREVEELKRLDELTKRQAEQDSLAAVYRAEIEEKRAENQRLIEELEAEAN